MKWQTLILAAALGAASAGVFATAPTETDTIAVSVSLFSSISVDLDQNAWNLGPMQLGSVSPWSPFTATAGNTKAKLEIVASNPAGGWIIGAAPNTDVFQVEVSSPTLSLTTSYQQLASRIPHYGNLGFSLRYYAPTQDTKGAETSESFTITVKASSTIVP